MIQFKVDARKLTRAIDKALTKKTPRAIATGLTRAAFDIRDDERKAMKQYLDRPKPFSLRGVAVQKATPARRTAYVYIQEIQARYLEYQVLGGSTTKPHVVPSKSARLDAYGNLPRNATKGSSVYQSTDKQGRRVYYRKTGGARDTWLTLLGFIPRSRTYRVRFPFVKIALASAKINVKKKIKREIGKLNLNS